MTKAVLVIVFIFFCIFCFGEQKSIRLVTKTEADALEALFQDSRLVADQSFFITIGGLKEAYFVSIHHDYEAGSYITFYIIKDNKVVWELPMDDARDYMLTQVDAVAFTDMNKDGFSDITILLSCFTGAGANGAVPYYLAAIFINNRRGGFANVPAIDDDITAKLNEDDTFNTIKDIAVYVDIQYNKSEY